MEAGTRECDLGQGVGALTHAENEPEQTVTERQALTEPGFLGYVVARGLTLVGDNIWWVAIGWAAAQLGDPGLTGLVLAVTGIPRIALMLIGGAVTDIRGSRPVMLASDFLAGVAALSAALLALSQGDTVAAWLLIAMGLVFGTVDAFYVPASSSYLASLVPKHALPRAVAIRQFTNGMSNAVGRSLGGVLVGAGGFALAAFVDGLSFFLCFAIFLFVRPKYPVADPPRTSVRRTLTDGLRYVWTHRTIRGLAMLTLMLNLVTTPLITVGLALRATSEGWGPGRYGLVAGAIGVGTVLGGLLGVVVPPPRRAGMALTIWAAAVCVPFAVLALGTDPTVAMVAAVVWGLCLGPSNAILSGLLMATVQQQMLGRVQSFVSTVANGLTPVGTAGFGGLVALTNLDVVGAICVAMLALTVIVMFLTPDVRNVRLPRE